MDEQNNAPIIEQESEKKGANRYRNFIFGLQIILFLFIVLAVILGLVAPQILMLLINIIWILTFIIVVIFLLLGGMIMFGLKDEAKKILDIFMEGSLTIVDVLDFIKLIIKDAIQLVKDIILFCVPFLAYTIGFLIYILLLILFKFVGKYYEVTLLTIGLTVFLVGIIGLLNRNKKNRQERTWLQQVQKRFQDVFGDVMEIIVFIFFLTMDIPDLFFLPQYLHTHLRAEMFGFNLMLRGWELVGIEFTFTVIMIAIAIELIRFALRILAGGVYFYRDINQYLGSDNPKFKPSEQIKHSIRQSFSANKDDMVKLIVYMTVLIMVFLAFPRLKLVSMAAASATALGLDLLFRDRLDIKRGTDLVGKILSKVFNI